MGYVSFAQGFNSGNSTYVLTPGSTTDTGCTPSSLKR